LKAFYLPVEILSRELDSKLALTYYLLEEGYTVVVGQQWAILNNLDNLPPGVILFKGYHGIFSKGIKRALEFGFSVFALEEENLGFADKSTLLQILEPSANAGIKFFANGRFEAKVLAENNFSVFSTGNPRADLLKGAYSHVFSQEILKVREKFGNFILINSNFATVNSTWGPIEKIIEIQERAGAIRKDDPASKERFFSIVESENKNRQVLQKLLIRLANSDTPQIVVRPHPMENIEPWEELISTCSIAGKVRVVREGSHIPWTLAATLLLHTACTTGLEAAVAGIPAINVSREDYFNKHYVSSLINPQLESVEQLLAVLHIKDQENLTQELKKTYYSDDKLASEYLENFPSNVFAAPSMANSMLAASRATPEFYPEIQGLRSTPRHPIQKNKFTISPRDFLERFLLVSRLNKIIRLNFKVLDDSLFQLTRL